MNKKFLSAILFGALMVTSTGTFVSCKDYDDDIDRIDKELSEVKTQIAALQTKIDAGKWITSVTPATGGFTVAFSDGSNYTITNGKDGLNGEAGAPGTEWTISEDGFWVCNGEKTTVKAVGQDGAEGKPGEAGKDAQPEVKKENGKWYLWNGTEFEEFAGAEAPATNVPYYYADPTDPNNYAILVVCDENGKNEKEIRLPLNEGLAQIDVLSASFNIAYSVAKEGTAWPKWEGGSKEKPAKGEYMIGQSTDYILVQISPASYDLSGKTVKAVNTKGEELPLQLGKAEPCTEVLPRAASPVGVYKIPVEGIIVNDEVVEKYDGKSVYASLVVNENVYSSFKDYDFTFSLKQASDATIQFGKYQLNDNGEEYFERWYVNAKPGESVTIVPDKYQAGQLFDSYITMQDNDAQAKADSIRYGISFDGMTIKTNDKAVGYVNFTVHYMNVLGRVHSYDFSLDFNERTDAEEITSIVSKKHVATAKAADQAFIADLKPYFDAMGADKRVVWNAEYRKMDPVSNYVDWVYEDAETGQTVEKVMCLVDGITVVDAEGKETAEAAKIAGIKVNFVDDYAGQLNEIIEKGGEFTATVNVKANVKTGANTSRYGTIAVLKIPFTIEKPSDATIAAAYTFTPSYYLNNVITVYGDEITNAQIFSAGIVNGYKPADADKDMISVDAAGNITLNAGKRNTVYTLTGGKVTYAGAQFPIADFKVMFAKSKNFTTVMPAAISIISGSGNAVTVKYGKAANKDDKNIYYRVDNISGVQDAIAGVAACEVEAKYASYLTASVGSDNAITLTTATGDAQKVSVTTPVKVTLTITTSTGEKVKDTITVNLTPYPAQ